MNKNVHVWFLNVLIWLSYLFTLRKIIYANEKVTTNKSILSGIDDNFLQVQ